MVTTSRFTAAHLPKVKGCCIVLQNIEGDGSAESCAFGAEVTEVSNNVNVKVGGQHVLDIIHDAIDKFGGSGKVGPNGNMKSNGNVEFPL
ncbi:hypothetical protein TruAng_011193 [Truncatella angustata]|nr:hypothetical protein TruAng_011193 [Truncatella angustata]